jgi:hypothetical protein
MHVGLNLVYLVPGETGGQEVNAPELTAAFLCREAEEHASQLETHGASDTGELPADAGGAMTAMSLAHRWLKIAAE